MNDLTCSELDMGITKEQLKEGEIILRLQKGEMLSEEEVSILINHYGPEYKIVLAV